jgi:hypothetical protein
MRLFIQMRDGQPFKHPILEDNFVEAFPDVDIDNLPPEFCEFIRVEKPSLGVYEVMEAETPTYELIDGVYKDVWHKRSMTDEEKSAKQQEVKDRWELSPIKSNFSAWTFNEETCSYEPPVPHPDDENKYFWQGTTSSWVLLPTYPDDGKKYKLDFSLANWVEVT